MSHMPDRAVEMWFKCLRLGSDITDIKGADWCRCRQKNVIFGLYVQPAVIPCEAKKYLSYLTDIFTSSLPPVVFASMTWGQNLTHAPGKDGKRVRGIKGKEVTALGMGKKKTLHFYSW